MTTPQTNPSFSEEAAEILRKYLYADKRASYSGLAPGEPLPEEVAISALQALHDRLVEAAVEDLRHRFADEMSWQISKGGIEMVSINLEQLLGKLTTKEDKTNEHR